MFRPGRRIGQFAVRRTTDPSAVWAPIPEMGWTDHLISILLYPPSPGGSQSNRRTSRGMTPRWPYMSIRSDEGYGPQVGVRGNRLRPVHRGNLCKGKEAMQTGAIGTAVSARSVVASSTRGELPLHGGPRGPADREEGGFAAALGHPCRNFASSADSEVQATCDTVPQGLVSRWSASSVGDCGA